MDDTRVVGGSDGLWLFALLILFGMGGGFGFGNNAGRCASVEDLNTTSNFARLESQVRSNADLTERKADGIANGLCDGFYTTAQQINGVNMNVMESRYLTEKTVADSNAAVLAAINGLSAKMDAEKIASLQAQVTELKNAQQFCGIPRINPYGYGVYPYTGCGGCGCNGNNNI